MAIGTKSNRQDIAVATSMFIAEINLSAGESDMSSPWIKFWKEFMLGARAFAGLQAPEPQVQR